MRRNEKIAREIDKGLDATIRYLERTESKLQECDRKELSELRRKTIVKLASNYKNLTVRDRHYLSEKQVLIDRLHSDRETKLFRQRYGS